MKLKPAIAALFILACSGFATAEELITPSFRVVVTENCPEGETTCDNVSYVGTNLKTGQSIKLKGTSVSQMCADKVTPCHRLGYKFKQGAYVYFVGEDGQLLVTRDGKTILSETGKWKD